MQHNEWIYMEVLDAMPDINILHCDTRDFHVCSTDGDVNIEQILKQMTSPAEEYMFARTEILGCLSALENASGGKKHWRMLHIKSSQDWLKYIRFVKYKDGYIACDQHYSPLTRQQLDADNVLPEME